MAVKQHEHMSLGHTSPESLCTSLMVTCPVLFLKLMLMTGSRTAARQKGKVVSLSSGRSSKSLTMDSPASVEESTVGAEN